MKKLSLDKQARRAYYDGVDLDLTVGEYRILAMLAAKPGSYLSYRDIYDTMRQRAGLFAGQGEDGINANVRTMIKRIRRKFERLDPAFDGILNYIAFGYGLHKDLIDQHCCPCCGQLTSGAPAETVVAGLVLDPA